MTLDEALIRIEELEKENKDFKTQNENLLKELEVCRAKKVGGRKKHDATWMRSYNDFVLKYEKGMSIMEIVAEGNISRRTAYRYKAYYDEIMKLKEKQKNE